jgi:isoleucyl-tRNA synthetase
VLLADRPPYERVLMHGFAMLDGKAMSKSRGHVLRPPEVVAEHGRDALRVHLLRHEQHEQDVNVTSDLSGVREVRDRLDVVWNTFRFATMYMEADDYSPQPSLTLDAGDRTAVDAWVLSRLASVVDEATEAFDDLRPNDALEATLDFLVEDVSRYYVQSVRDRVWTTEMTAEKSEAYDTLGTVLHATVRLLAPFAPFLSDRLYEALDGEEPTVHATDWPRFDDDLRDEQLESELTSLRSVEEAVSKARQKAGRKHRWPVPEVVVESATSASPLGAAVEAHEDHLKDRLNAKSVRVTSDFEETSRRVVPEMSALGPAFGEAAPDVAESVRGAPVADLPLTVEVNGEDVTVTREHVDVEEHVPGRFEAAAFDDGAVYVDTSLSTELRREGVARDVVRRLQSMRQSMGLSFDDSVVAHVGGESEEVAAAVQSHRDWVLEEVRAKTLSDEPQEYAETWEVGDATVELSLSRSE